MLEGRLIFLLRVSSNEDTNERNESILKHSMGNLEKALGLVCELLADHECPNDYDLAEWVKCENCPKGYEVRYDVQRDIDCWKRWAIEKAEREMK